MRDFSVFFFSLSLVLSGVIINTKTFSFQFIRVRKFLSCYSIADSIYTVFFCENKMICACLIHKERERDARLVVLHRKFLLRPLDEWTMSRIYSVYEKHCSRWAAHIAHSRRAERRSHWEYTREQDRERKKERNENNRDKYKLLSNNEERKSLYMYMNINTHMYVHIYEWKKKSKRKKRIRMIWKYKHFQYNLCRRKFYSSIDGCDSTIHSLRFIDISVYSIFIWMFLS